MTMPERRRRNSVLAALEAARKADPSLSSTGLLVFLYVCENPGLNVRELAQVAGLTEATASRAALALAEGPALLSGEPNPRDGRGKILFPSEAGAALRDRIDGLIAEARPIGAGRSE